VAASSFRILCFRSPTSRFSLLQRMSPSPSLGAAAEPYYHWTDGMKLRDCKRIADCGVGRINADNLEPLWITDYYDGPLSGAVLHGGQFCWYVLAEEEQEPMGPIGAGSNRARTTIFFTSPTRSAHP
jgi:hypothetical protein